MAKTVRAWGLKYRYDGSGGVVPASIQRKKYLRKDVTSNWEIVHVEIRELPKKRKVVGK